MIDVELREDLLDRLRDFPARLQTTIDGVDDALLTRAGPGGGWGAVEIFCHLRDQDEVTIERVKRILRESVPAINPVDDSLWPIQRDYHLQNPRSALAEFAKRRASLVTLLDGLDPTQWQRLGIHYQHGRRPLTWFIEQIATHDQENLEQLRKAVC
jgi:hypothetical protein